MAKKNPKQRKRDEADILFSRIVRSVGVCQAKGLDELKCHGNLQCCHIISRRNMKLRWDRKNALSMCQAHHIFYTFHPWEWVEFIKKNFPAKYRYVNKYREEIWDKDIERVLGELNEQARICL